MQKKKYNFKTSRVEILNYEELYEKTKQVAGGGPPGQQGKQPSFEIRINESKKVTPADELEGELKKMGLTPDTINRIKVVISKQYLVPARDYVNATCLKVVFFLLQDIGKFVLRLCSL